MGIIQIGGKLPPLVYALITGFNAATVGIVALAAVFLSNKAITDIPTRILVLIGASAGLLYNALWYFPVLMIVGGLATISWDYRLDKCLSRRLMKTRNMKERDIEANIELTESKAVSSINSAVQKEDPVESTNQSASVSTAPSTAPSVSEASKTCDPAIKPPIVNDTTPENIEIHVFPWKIGVIIIAVFFMTLIAVVVLRSVLENRPRSLDLFANLYLAGESLS